MQHPLSLDDMSVFETLNMINDIWHSFVKNEAAVPSIEWHKDVLNARQERVDRGVAQFESLDVVKKSLRSQFK